MKSKIFYIGLMVLLLVGYLYPAQVTKANGLEEDQEDKIEEPLVISATDRENLKSLGFTDEEIDNISSEEYALNNGLKGEIIDSYTKYYKVYESTDEANKVAGENKVQAFSYDNLSGEVEITAEQYYNELEQLSLADENNTGTFKALANSASSSKSTSYKTMTTSISKLATNKYRVKVNVHWNKKMPGNRKIDVLGVGFNNAQWRPSKEEYGKQTWKIFNTKTSKNTTGSATYTSSSNKWKYGKDAYTLKMNLKNDPSSSEKVTDINMYMYYTVTPTGSLPTYLDAYGQYSHQEEKVEITPTINFDGTGGFSISNSTKFTHSYVQATLKTK